MVAARHLAYVNAQGLPYIMPDGNSWWDTGFVASAGCEYVIDATWLRFPRGYGYDSPFLSDNVFKSGCATPLTFNYGVRGRDCLTTQIGQPECFCYDVSSFTGVRSTIRIRHHIDGNTFSVGFDGGTAGTSTTNSTLTSATSLVLCNSHGLGSSARPIPADIVKIYAVSAYRNGVHEMSLVPKMAGGRPCFYDKVSEVAHFSIGTSDGIYGVE